MTTEDAAVWLCPVTRSFTHNFWAIRMRIARPSISSDPYTNYANAVISKKLYIFHKLFIIKLKTKNDFNKNVKKNKFVKKLYT